MRISSLILLQIFFFLFTCSEIHAFDLSDRSEVSVLTCSPGNEMYSVYGHSAIRIKDLSNNYDVVFNYGIFDFSAPNFLYRFASGQTDYLLGAYSFPDFLSDYIASERSVFEQVLNFNQSEKQNIFDFLVWNAKPENRVYRYNFFFDNCATRVRDVVARQVNGEVIFPEKPEVQKTFRQLIKDYHSKLIWLNFGIDLVVSAPADRVATVSEEMFLPDYIMKYFAEAVVKTNEGAKPLVKESGVIYKASDVKVKNLMIINPFVVFALLFVVTLFISVRQLKRNNITPWMDYLVYGITGFVGLLMLWLVLFSEHPAMKPNYNLLWAVPLNLVFAIFWRLEKWRPVLKYYHVIISAWLVLFVLSESFLPQKFHPAHYFFILIILSRSIIHSMSILKNLQTKA